MRYIYVTHIDVDTGVICTEAPMRTGPTFPVVSGFVYGWAKESEWPIETNSDGSYITLPEFYATCDDDADLTVVGVLGELTKDDWYAAKQLETIAMKPFPSFVWNETFSEWEPPIDRPDNAILNGGDTRYYWDEEIVNWVAMV